MRTHYLALALASLLLTGGAFAAAADQGAPTPPRIERPGRGPGFHRVGPRGGMGMGHHQRLLSDPDLSADQQSRLLDAMTRNYRARLELAIEQAKARREADELRRDDSATPEAIIAAGRTLGEVRGKIEALDRDFRRELRDIVPGDRWERLEREPRHWDDDDDDDDDGDVRRRPSHRERRQHGRGHRK